VWELQNSFFDGLARCGCLLGVGELVDQCSLRMLFVGRVEEESGEEDKSFRRGGKGRDGCSPEIREDIRVVGGEGSLVVPSASP